MSQTRYPMRSKIIIAILILGLIAFVVYFVFFINPAQVAATLEKTNLTIYSLAFVSYSLYVLFASLVWQRLLSNLAVKISKRKTLLYAWVGLFFDATVPQLGWSSEVSKTYLLAKDSKIGTGKIAASVVGQKIFTIATSIGALGFGLAAVLVSYPLDPVVSFLFALVLALSIVTLIVLCYVSFKPKATLRMLNWAIGVAQRFRRKWNPEGFKAKTQGLLGQFHGGISSLRAEPKRLVVPIAYSLTGFAFEVSVLSLSFVALGYPVPIDKVLIVFTLTGTLQTVGVTIFGFPEVIMSASFNALGIPLALSFSVTLLTRAVNLWFRLAVSYGALQWAGIKIVRNRTEVPLTSVPEAVSAG
jgi:uncharacterized protein (TIRG00374 family)